MMSTGVSLLAARRAPRLLRGPAGRPPGAAGPRVTTCRNGDSHLHARCAGAANFGCALRAWRSWPASIASGAASPKAFHRANRSPLGAGAGTTSSFRHQSRPARGRSSASTASSTMPSTPTWSRPSIRRWSSLRILSTLAIVLGQLTQDLHAQFYLADPWLTLDPSSKLTGISSMMPQKRNPRVLELLREHASVIIGSAGSMVLLAHNAASGMTDVRESVTTVAPARPCA